MDDKQQTKHFTILSYMFIGEVLSFCSQRFYCKYSNMTKPKLQKKVLIKEAITTELISTTIYNNTAPGPSQYIFLVPVPTNYSYKLT